MTKYLCSVLELFFSMLFAHLYIGIQQCCLISVWERFLTNFLLCFSEYVWRQPVSSNPLLWLERVKSTCLSLRKPVGKLFHHSHQTWMGKNTIFAASKKTNIGYRCVEFRGGFFFSFWVGGYVCICGFQIFRVFPLPILIGLFVWFLCLSSAPTEWNPFKFNSFLPDWFLVN